MKTRFLISLLTSIVITACASEPKVTEFAESTDSQTEIDRLDNNLIDSRDHQVDILSPQNYTNAETYRQEAVSGRAAGRKQNKVLHTIAVANAYLDKAQASADVARTALDPAVEARRDALIARAPVYYPKGMRDTDERMLKVTRDIEKNRPTNAVKMRDDLTNSYRYLERLSIKDASLARAVSTTNQAIKEGAEKLTPQTLQQMREQLVLSQNKILAHPHDNLLVFSAATDADNASRRLLRMVREARAATKASPEELARSRVALDKTTEQKSNLESRVWLENEFQKANQQFSQDEAEVYKQGDKLLLRLKGLNFPKDQSVITADNYDLLAKVQTVLKDVAPSDVVVEGHTDARGPKELNDNLSLKRAEAVQNYLISNNSVPEEKITAKGYGYTRPIATNKTVEGRAQNRRVDIVITPERVATEMKGSPQ